MTLLLKYAKSRILLNTCHYKASLTDHVIRSSKTDWTTVCVKAGSGFFHTTRYLPRVFTETCWPAYDQLKDYTRSKIITVCFLNTIHSHMFTVFGPHSKREYITRYYITGAKSVQLSRKRSNELARKCTNQTRKSRKDKKTFNSI